MIRVQNILRTWEHVVSFSSLCYDGGNIFFSLLFTVSEKACFGRAIWRSVRERRQKKLIYFFWV